MTIDYTIEVEISISNDRKRNRIVNQVMRNLQAITSFQDEWLNKRGIGVLRPQIYTLCMIDPYVTHCKIIHPVNDIICVGAGKTAYCSQILITVK
jgi:hypothetical protein